MKILIVDKDKKFTESLKLALEKENYEIYIKNNFRDFLKNISEIKPEVVVLEIIMNKGISEGFVWARRLRNIPDFKNVHIIICSNINKTFPFRFDTDKRFLPVDIFLEKPITPLQFIKCLRKFVLPNKE